MLTEEEEMEKKSTNRTSSVPPPKATGAEPKKSENNGQNNKYPRYPKSKENRTGTSTRPWTDNGQSKRLHSQRNDKGYNDRRSRQRVYPNAYPSEEVAEESGAELGSALQVGSKKANLNHLLNFTYSPREYRSTPGYSDTSWKGRNKWSKKKSCTAYSKEQFLQANCQFVASEGRDYAIHTVDPDVMIAWEQVEQVRILSHEVPSCPICLYPPTAAKMTRCGHIYCWSCILHYLSLEDMSWSKCPICYHPIHRKDLKSVVPMATHHYKVGQEITMVLMKKAKGSIIALPKSEWTAGIDKPLGVKAAVNTSFSKLLIAKPEDIQSIIDQEKAALMAQKSNDCDSIEGSFLDAALNDLEEREIRLLELQKAASDASEMLEKANIGDDRQDDKSHVVAPDSKKKEKIVVYASAFSDEEEDQLAGEDDDEVEDTVSSSCDQESLSEPSSRDRSRLDSTMSLDSTVSSDSSSANTPPEQTFLQDHTTDATVMPVEEAAEQLELPHATEQQKVRKRMTKSEVSDAYYFYQAADGQQIFMHSLNAKCLAKEYGSLENCPEMVTMRIEEMEGVSMNHELRKRLRYLGHLPLISEFQVAELAMKPPLISKETLKSFRDDLERRRKCRQKKARDDKRHTKRIEARERELLGDYHNVTIVRSAQPTLRTSASMPVISPVVDTPPDIVDNQESTEFPSVSSCTNLKNLDENVQQQSSGGVMSFAQMLCSGKIKPDVRPRPTSSNKSDVKSPKTDNPSDDEDHVPAPTFQSSFSDAFQAALDTIDKDAGKDSKEVTTGGNKKKKKPKKLLFTTTMNRAK